jgi:Txe/YoeB family toxin of Txe-Axe toxin-antitoxin module
LKKVINFLKQNIESFEKWKSEHYDKASIDTEIVEIIENDGLKFQEENKLKEQQSNKSLFDEKRLEESKRFLRRVSNGWRSLVITACLRLKYLVV